MATHGREVTWRLVDHWTLDAVVSPVQAGYIELPEVHSTDDDIIIYILEIDRPQGLSESRPDLVNVLKSYFSRILLTTILSWLDRRMQYGGSG
jgi:hypothetical protein